MDEPSFFAPEQIVQKIKSDHAHGIKIVPDWGYTKWYKELLPFWKRDVLFEKGCKVFELGGKICNGTRWPIRAIFLMLAAPLLKAPNYTHLNRLQEGLHGNFFIFNAQKYPSFLC